MSKELGRADLEAAVDYKHRRAYKSQCVWNNKMARLLAKEPMPLAQALNMMPKGEVQ